MRESFKAKAQMRVCKRRLSLDTHYNRIYKFFVSTLDCSNRRINNWGQVYSSTTNAPCVYTKKFIAVLEGGPEPQPLWVVLRKCPYNDFASCVMRSLQMLWLISMCWLVYGNTYCLKIELLCFPNSDLSQVNQLMRVGSCRLRYGVLLGGAGCGWHLHQNMWTLQNDLPKSCGDEPCIPWCCFPED